MNLSSRKKRILVAIALTAFLILPVTLLLITRQQTISTQASSGTSLSFIPESNEEQPIEAKTNEELTVDLMVEPGEGNLISFVKFVIEFDTEFVEIISEDAFVPNSDDFPEILEDITIEDGTLTGSISVGSDGTKAVSTPTKLGTLTLLPKKETGDTPTVVTYTADSQVLSIGEEDDPDASVLSNTGAAFLTVTKGSGSAPKDELTKKDTTDDTTEKSTDLVRPRFPLDVEPIDPADGDTTLTIKALLHGIGSSGDSVNPKNSSLSNKEPKKTSRVVAVSIWDIDDLLVAEGFTRLAYDKKTGAYLGSFVTDKPLPDDTYAITITVEGYLTSVLEDFELKEGEENELGDLQFVAGDIQADEKIDILDYTILADCGYGATTQLPMDNPKSLYESAACKKHEAREDADLDSNGTIDGKDFNLFLREFAAQKKLETTEINPESKPPTPTPTKS